MTVAVRVSSRRELGPAAAQVAGWALLACVNAIVIARTVPMPPPPGLAVRLASLGRVGRWLPSGLESALRSAIGWAEAPEVQLRALHYLYDAGQLVALGMLAWTGVELWRLARRRIPRLRRAGGPWGYVALAVVATSVGVPVLETDLVGLASRPFGERHATFALAALLATAGVAIAVAAKVGSLCARLKVRYAGVIAGLAVGAMNNFVLRHDYPGVHFYLAWGAATLMGASLAGIRFPFTLPRVVLPILAVPAGVALGKVPMNSLQLELLRLPGAVAAPLVARAGMTREHAATVWQDTDPGPDVPASTPSLIASNGIVLLIVVDALRADVIANGAHADRLPQMEALRRESVELSHVWSPASGTIWTISSLFSGRYYSQLYWSVKKDSPTTKVYPHEDTSVRFTEVLARAGIRSLTVSEMPDVSNAYGVLRGITVEHPMPGLGFPATALFDVLLSSLDDVRGGQRTRFAYIHLLDAHSPYTRITKEGTPYERYLGELALVDQEVGRLRRVLAARGLAGRTTIILTADHGEAFGEHGTMAHGVSVYDELLRVPLLIHVPGVAPRRVDRDISLMDLGPTVLDLMGQPTPGTNMGESLVPILRGKDPELRRPIAAETGRMQQAMIFPDGFKVIRDKLHATFEVYDLVHDPGELHNLSGSPAVNVKDYLGQLDAFFYVHALRRPGYVMPMRW
jgi:hypothetical protein